MEASSCKACNHVRTGVEERNRITLYPESAGQTLQTLVQQHFNFTSGQYERDQDCPECKGKTAVFNRGVQSQPHLAAAPHAWSCCMHGSSRRAFPEPHAANINMLISNHARCAGPLASAPPVVCVVIQQTKTLKRNPTVASTAAPRSVKLPAANEIIELPVCTGHASRSSGWRCVSQQYKLQSAVVCTKCGAGEDNHYTCLGRAVEVSR